MNRELQKAHNQAKRIFHRVCDLEQGHRTRTLRAICDGDLQIEEEVRSLLQADIANAPGEDPDTPATSSL